MSKTISRVAIAFASIAAASAASATDHDLRTVSAMKQHNRVLLAFAPTLTDARLETQRQTIARFAAKAATRDLLFVQVASDKVIGAKDAAAPLRAKFKVAPGDYRTLLIGKDGNVALRQAEPIGEADLETTIDRMPMRREEVAHAKAGLGRPEK